AAATIGFPAILKLPDGSFSRAVVRADDEASFRQHAATFLQSSDLAIAQEFLPTEFDWRIGVLDRQVLFVCRYRMARGHWQIARHGEEGSVRFGAVEPVALDAVPPQVLEIGHRAANLVGDGLYGVDVKQTGDRIVVIEINDN